MCVAVRISNVGFRNHNKKRFCIKLNRDTPNLAVVMSKPFVSSDLGRRPTYTLSQKFWTSILSASHF